MQLVLALLDDAVVRLGHLDPGARQVAERLRHDEARLVAQPVEERIVRIELAQGRDEGAVEERPRVALAGVAEAPDLRPVGRGDGHLDRVLDAVLAARLLDEPDRLGDRARRIVLEPEGEREVEEGLGIGRALDLREERGIDGDLKVALNRVELADRAVVLPEPAAVPERMAVRLLDRGAGRRADVREDEAGHGVGGDLLQVALVPGGLDAVVDGGRVADAVPADPESVAVRGRRAHPWN